MKKVLLAFDGSHFSTGAFEFANELNKRKKILLIGVFIPQVDYANLWSYAEGSMSGPMFIPLVEDENTIEVAKNIEHFESACKKNDIEYRVHKDFSDFAMPELKKESRFADLLILGSESFYENLGTTEPNEYLKDALHGMECPIIVVPEKYVFPKSNILAYDGSESAVYAIKQFAYILPELAGNSTTLVFAKKNEEKLLPDEVYIEELAARHFRDLTLFKFSGDPDKYFISELLEKKHAIIISGSYSKSGIAGLFHKNFLKHIIQDHRIPVFIAHRN